MLARCALVVAVLLVFSSVAFGQSASDVDPSLLANKLPPNALKRFGSNRLRHTHSVRAVAFSPDGNYLATAGMERYVRIWSVADGDLHNLLADEEGWGFMSLAFSPSSQELAAIDEEGNVVVWDIEKGQLLWRKKNHDGRGTQISFFSDRPWIATSGASGSVVINHSRTGETIQSITSDANVRDGLQFAISPDGSTIAIAAQRDIEIVEVANPTNRRRLKNSHGFSCESLEFTPDGISLLSGGTTRSSQQVQGKRMLVSQAERRLWSVEDETLIREFTIPTADRGRASCRLSPNGGFLVGFGEDAMVVWSTESGEIVKSFEYVSSNASRSRSGLAISPDGTLLAAVDRGSSVLVWNLHTGESKYDANPAHSSRVTDVVFSPDGRLIGSVGGGDIRVWEIDFGKLLSTMVPLGLSPATVHSIDFSNGGSQLIAAGECYTPKRGFGGTISLWETSTGRNLRSKLLPGRCTYVKVDDAQDVVVVGSGMTLRGFGGENREAEPKIDQFTKDLSLSVSGPDISSGRIREAFIGSNGRITFVTEGGNLMRWNNDEDQVHEFKLKALRNLIHSAAISKDGNLLVTSGLFDPAIYVWQVEPEQQLSQFLYADTMGSSVAISPDSAMIAVAPISLTSTSKEFAKNIKVWSQAGEALCELQIGLANASCLAFSPDGSLLVSGHQDGTLTLWQIP
ncbi:MAG: WD40 repeat domain-containing protein [Pirellulaceae bacterium]|jgi:WD40 repeat protein